MKGKQGTGVFFFLNIRVAALMSHDGLLFAPSELFKIWVEKRSWGVGVGRRVGLVLWFWFW